MPIANKVTNFIRGNFNRLRWQLQKRRFLSKQPRLTSLFGFLRSRLWQVRIRFAKRKLLAAGEPSTLDVAVNDWPRSLNDPTGFYIDCFRYFHLSLPSELRAHRRYFERGARGFGEDAFHVMWFLIFRQFRPADFLEIGVYRGQTLSLAGFLARLLKIQCATYGISPFSAAGDSVSEYRTGIDYFADTQTNFVHFGLPEPFLLKAFSTDQTALDLIKSHSWDCIYIDGNHDYEIAKADWNNCSASVKPGGLIVLDDAGLGTSFKPTIFASNGHFGPSRVAAEIDSRRFKEILQVGHNRVFQKIT